MELGNNKLNIGENGANKNQVCTVNILNAVVIRLTTEKPKDNKTFGAHVK